MVGWLAVATVIIAYDTWAIKTDHRTMSAAYTAHRWPVLVTVVVVAHLQHRPRRLARYDPFNWAAGRIAPQRKQVL